METKTSGPASGTGSGGMTDEEWLDVEDRAMAAKDALMGMIFAALRMRGRNLRAAERSLPLTIIGGFLGSGKTTLLSHLLTAQQGRRLVVLVNDFGQINIDAALVASQTEDMISLTNGCACCSVSADLTNKLIEIAEREDRPDAIVIEASGVADPNAIAQIALSNPSIRLDGSLVVVDAETIFQLAENPATSRLFRNQIRAADLIVLAKVDLIGEDGRAAALEWLATHYPGKRVIEAVKGNLPTDLVLGIGTHRDLQAEPRDDSDHAQRFESIGMTVDRPLDRECLRRVFDALPVEVLRAKGVLDLAGANGRRTIYQRVGGRWAIETGAPWGETMPRSSLVFIAPVGVLNRDALKRNVADCVVDGDDTVVHAQADHFHSGD